MSIGVLYRMITVITITIAAIIAAIAATVITTTAMGTEIILRRRSQNPPPSIENIARGIRNQTPPLQSVPPTGVVTVPESEFGREKRGYRTPPLATAKEILSKVPETVDTPPILPDMKDLNGKVSKEILLEKPRVVRTEPTVKIGASERRLTRRLIVSWNKNVSSETALLFSQKPKKAKRKPTTAQKAE